MQAAGPDSANYNLWGGRFYATTKWTKFREIVEKLWGRFIKVSVKLTTYIASYKKNLRELL